MKKSIAFALTVMVMLTACNPGTKNGGDDFEEEGPMPVKNYKSIDREGYTLKYDARWDEAVDNEEYDEDEFFSFDVPGNGFVSFRIFPNAEDFFLLVKEEGDLILDEIMVDGEKTEFKRWGNYHGSGIKMHGNILGLDPGVIRVFGYGNDEQAFLVWEYKYDSEFMEFSEGFNLIENSFKLK